MTAATLTKRNQIKRPLSERIFSVVNALLLLLICFVCLYPVWYVAMASLSDSGLLTQHQGLLFLPLGFTFNAYTKVFKNPMIVRGYLNTLFILGVGVFVDIVMTSLGAYFLSRKQVLFKKPIMMMIIFTMFFSGGMIPFYLNLRDLHLTDSLQGLIIPFMINTYNLVIMRTSFESIPDSLVEAAQIDGASHVRILFPSSSRSPRPSLPSWCSTMASASGIPGSGQQPSSGLASYCPCRSSCGKFSCPMT